MAPNKKKKKAASNPARGFATTSLPSKAKDIAIPTSNPAADGSTADRETVGRPEEAAHEMQPSHPHSVQQMSPQELEAHLEDADLQNFINTHGARCKQDASRQITRLETERRQLRSQSHRVATATWLPANTVDEVLLESIEYTRARPDIKSARLLTLGDPDILLLRLWTLQCILVALKLSDVEVVIRYILELALHGSVKATDLVWGLHDAFEWYAIHKGQEELPDYEDGTISAYANIASNLEDSEEFESKKDEHKIEQREVCLNDVPPEKTSDEEPPDDLDAIPSSDSDEDDPATFIQRYQTLQTLLYNINRRANIAKNVSISRRKLLLEGKIKKLKRDPLFDVNAAEAMWQSTLREIDLEAARSAKSKKKLAGLSELEGANACVLDTGDHEEEELLGDIFAMNEEAATQSVSPQKDVRILADCGKWSGAHPRKLMEESCRIIDSKCKVRFSTLSATSYSVRQKIDVSWTLSCVMDDRAVAAVSKDLLVKSQHRALQVEMEHIAAVNSLQAEAYLATAVLFLLSKCGLNDQKQFHRLPTLWRSVYQNFEESRAQIVNADDKLILKQLRHAIEESEDRVTTLGIGAKHTGQEKGKNETAQAPTKRPDKRDKLSSEHACNLWSAKTSSPAYIEMLLIRSQLPVYQHKNQVLDAIDSNQLIIICADTGAGKSTQIPTFILEHELSNGRDCRILVTQPRRISAISLARRVSQELGERAVELGTDRSLIGYAIRLESKVSKTTRITFATTGVLLRMIESSPNLDDIECLVLDEVHERTLDLDLLFIALLKLKERRANLKIVLMSATVNAQKFSDYFGGAPVLDIPGRTFPVQVKYLEDAVEDILSRFDKRDAGIADAKKTVPADTDSAADDTPDETGKEPQSSLNLKDYSHKTRCFLSNLNEFRIDFDLVADLTAFIAIDAKYEAFSSAILIFMPGLAEIRRLQSLLLTRDEFTHGWIIHLLHSSFSTDDLERAFAIPPAGQRKIVISTNIAETGITIPDVTAVIDTCKEKIMRFNEKRQLSKLTEVFISRSSARQRKGRAARVRAGLCFHLVTKHRYESAMLEQHVPEMLRLSLQDPILRIKIWDLGTIETTLSAAIDPPAAKNVRRAIEKLKDAGALDVMENLTPLGKQVARLPLEVGLGKLTLLGIVFNCLDAVITIVAVLSSKSPFLSDRGGSQTTQRHSFSRGHSDLLSTYNAYQGWKNARIADKAQQFCRSHHLSDLTLLSIEDQKTQLILNLADAGLVDLRSDERAALNKARGFGRQRQFFEVPTRYNANQEDHLVNAVIALAFYPKILVREGKGWRNVYTNQQMSLTSASVNRTAEKPPKWLCFYEALQSKSGALNVLETSKIPESVIMLLMGDAEFRYFSGVISLDNGRSRFCLRQWRQMAAIRAIREHTTRALHTCWQTRGLSLENPDRAWIEKFAALVAEVDTRTQRDL